MHLFKRIFILSLCILSIYFIFSRQEKQEEALKTLQQQAAQVKAEAKNQQLNSSCPGSKEAS